MKIVPMSSTWDKLLGGVPGLPLGPLYSFSSLLETCGDVDELLLQVESFL